MVNGAKQVNIPLGYGIHRTPSIGTDGELSECVNLIPKHGELVNIQPPQPLTFEHDNGSEIVEETLFLGSNQTLMAVHKTNLFTHYIVLTDPAVKTVTGRPRRKAPVLQKEIRLTQEPDDEVSGGAEINLTTNYAGEIEFNLVLSNGTKVPAAITEDDQGNYILNITYGEDNTAEISDSGGSSGRHFTLITPDLGWDKDTNQFIDIEVDPSERITPDGQGGQTETTTTFDKTIELYEENEGDLQENTITSEGTFYTLSWTEHGVNGGVGSFHEICSSLLSDPIKKVQTIGNTLVVMFAERIEYYLWRDDQYVSLGSGLPELDIRLALKGEFKKITSESWVKLWDDDSNIYDSDPTTISQNSGIGGTETPDSPFAVGLYKIVNKGYGDVVLTFTYTVSDIVLVDNEITVKRNKQAVITLYHACSAVSYRNKKGTYPIDVRIYSGVKAESHWRVDRTEEAFTTILGIANKFISESEKEGKFVTPFFARVGLRMYDQSISHITVPILMTPNTGAAPYIFADESTFDSSVGDQDQFSLYLPSAIGFRANLQYKIENGVLNRLKDWKDIILGISISVTPPIYTYNQGAKFYDDREIFHTVDYPIADGVPDATIGWFYGKYVKGASAQKEYSLYSVKEGFIAEKPISTRSTLTQIHLPSFSESEIRQHYAEFAQFNVLKDIDTEDLVPNEWTDVDTSNMDVSLSENWELFPDDNQSNDSISASMAFTYNSRLHLAGISKYFWKGQYPEYMEGFIDLFEIVDVYDSWCRVITKIIEDGVIYYADTGWGKKLNCTFWPWFYYPNRNAVSATIYVKVYDSDEDEYSYSKAELTLEKHKLLNGAFWFKEYESIPFETITLSAGQENPALQEYPRTPYTQPNRLYVSDANNPFVFPARISVGDEAIIGMSTATEALSEGQFGTFPLFVFCTDGVWTLSVGDTGSYTNVVPLSRDVCTNPESITQLDKAIVFVTKQGLKMFDRSTPILLSEELNGYNVSEDFFSTRVESFTTQENNILIPDTTQFVEQVQKARIAYDYPHNLLHVFMDELVSESGEQERHYVYSFDEKAWSTQVTNLGPCYAVAPGYPLTTLQLGNTLCVYDNVVSSDKRLGFALTRINNLGNPLARKMLYDLRTVGHFFSDGTRKLAVFVSNDKQHWYLLDSLKKLSARYYRFLLLTHMTDNDAVNGITAQIVEKMTNKIR